MARPNNDARQSRDRLASESKDGSRDDVQGLREEADSLVERLNGLEDQPGAHDVRDSVRRASAATLAYTRLLEENAEPDRAERTKIGMRAAAVALGSAVTYLGVAGYALGSLYLQGFYQQATNSSFASFGLLDALSALFYHAEVLLILLFPLFLVGLVKWREYTHPRQTAAAIELMAAAHALEHVRRVSDDAPRGRGGIFRGDLRERGSRSVEEEQLDELVVSSLENLKQTAKRTFPDYRNSALRLLEKSRPPDSAVQLWSVVILITVVEAGGAVANWVARLAGWFTVHLAFSGAVLFGFSVIAALVLFALGTRLLAYEAAQQVDTPDLSRVFSRAIAACAALVLLGFVAFAVGQVDAAVSVAEPQSHFAFVDVRYNQGGIQVSTSGWLMTVPGSSDTYLLKGHGLHMVVHVPATRVYSIETTVPRL